MKRGRVGIPEQFIPIPSGGIPGHSIWPATSGGGDTPGASFSCYVLPRAPAGILLTFGLLGLRTPGGSDAYCVMRYALCALVVG